MTAKLSLRKDTNVLVIEFTFMGVRFRENSGLKNSKNNTKLLKLKVDEINEAILSPSFNLRAIFPQSKNLDKFDKLNIPTSINVKPLYQEGTLLEYPNFDKFVATWMQENDIVWRESHRKNVLSIVRRYLLPEFAKLKVNAIQREHILGFRANLGQLLDRNGNRKLSNARINKIMSILRAVTNEACARFLFPTPFINFKQLKNNPKDIYPFALHEVFLILKNVRTDYQNYYTVRFFTGMRTGEIDGLKWQYVDFEKKIISIRETIVDGRQEKGAKTQSSFRDITMSEMVFEAMQSQYRATAHLSDYVFCNTKGLPLSHRNITKRVWHPLLVQLKLTARKPYQSRHTAATLWLAAGEAPEWIAKQLGHANTQMLFTVYSRYVPNLTRQDGSAFESLLQNHIGDASC